MCGCSTSHPSTWDAGVEGKLAFQVEDMTCGHCAAAITKAVRNGIPGADVAADPASKTVRVTGTADRDAVRLLIAGAGYTPVDATAA